MNRQLPIGNKYLSKKWREKEHEMHLQKLNGMKPYMNVKAPENYDHLNNKAKK